MFGEDGETIRLNGDYKKLIEDIEKLSDKLYASYNEDGSYASVTVGVEGYDYYFLDIYDDCYDTYAPIKAYERMEQWADMKKVFELADDYIAKYKSVAFE